MPRILLTHTPAALEKYYGARALAALEAIAEVRRNPLDREWTEDELVDAARGCDIVISYRQTAAPAATLSRLADIVAFSRCAIDIRNIDVAAASAAGILVTQASAGFVTAVAEWVIGAMIDLSRSISAMSEAYHGGRVPAAPMGRELRGATLGVIGYGQIGRALCPLARAFGMRVLVCDPYATVDDASLEQVGQDMLLAQADYVVCLAVATWDPLESTCRHASLSIL